MQISKICNEAFGLQFTDRIKKIFDKGRISVNIRNPKSLDGWDNDKITISHMYNDSFTLDAQESEDKTDIVLLEGNKLLGTVWTLQPEETLDRTYMVVLKNELEKLK